MSCENHPEKTETGLCTGCQEPYCEECLVSFNNEKYCSECKYMNVNPAVFYEEVEKCEPEEAGEALKYSLIGIFCFGIILGPIAMNKGFKALGIIKQDPFHKKGRTKAAFGILMGFYCLAFWLLNIIDRVKSGPN